MAFAKNPSAYMRLIANGQDNVGTSAEDLTTFVDITPYEYVLCIAQYSSTVTSVTSGTMKFVSSAASTGTSPVTAKDTQATPVDILATIATPANGTTLALWVRTRGLLKFGSLQLLNAGAAAEMSYCMFGVGVRDTAELAAGWASATSATNTFLSAATAVVETATS